MSYQSDFEGLEGWDYAVIVACLGGFLILGLLVRLPLSFQPEIKRNTWHTNCDHCPEYQCIQYMQNKSFGMNGGCMYT